MILPLNHHFFNECAFCHHPTLEHPPSICFEIRLHNETFEWDVGYECVCLLGSQRYWVYSHVPEWGEDKYLSLQFHDGAFTGEGGTYYPAPHPSHIRLLR